MRCEYLSATASRRAAEMLGAMRAVEPGPITAAYAGECEWLMTWGAGHPVHAAALARHRGPSAAWDLGYFGTGFCRVSLGGWHPTPAHIERTPARPARWDALGIALRNDADAAGPILLIGMGPKSRHHLRTQDWELRTLRRLRAQHPRRHIRFRPKPGRAFRRLDCELSTEPAIADALRGAALVVCRHSNVAVDACIAGVPVECEDGAARWLEGREYDAATRLDFLRRLAWWQWRSDEARQAWNFIEGMACD